MLLDSIFPLHYKALQGEVDWYIPAVILARSGIYPIW